MSTQLSHSNKIVVPKHIAFPSTYLLQITKSNLMYPSSLPKISQTVQNNTTFESACNRDINASVSSKHQHPPGLTPGGIFLRGSNSLPPGRKFLRNYGPGAKKQTKTPPLGTILVDLQGNFAMIMMKPLAFFWYSSLAWLSSSFLKDYKACEYKISQ